MKARVQTKPQPVGYNIYNVMRGNVLVKSFYGKEEAVELRKRINK